jgi:hypothetical protein
MDASAPAAPPRLRVINGSDGDLWIFWLRGAGGGDMDAPHQIRLTAGAHYDYPIPVIGIAGTRFWAGWDCDDTGNNCTIGQSGGPSDEGFTCPSDDGCAPPIDSKFEGTFGCLPTTPSDECQVNPSSPTGARLPTTDGWDTSMVDGFTLPFTVRVVGDCPGGPMSGMIDCSAVPLSQCPTTADLSSGGMFPDYASLSQVAMNPTDLDPAGCYSDCGRLTYGQWDQTPALLPSAPAALAYCCPTPPVEPATCRSGPVASTAYTSLVHRTCPQIYAYGYDDGVGLFSCPAGVRYDVTFYAPR